jgi:hypothetical protein
MSTLSIYPHVTTQTAKLRAEIAEAIAALPPTHLLRPVQNEVFADPEDAYIRIKNWGFAQGVVLVKESTNEARGRWQIECSRHHAKTRNSRKTPVSERSRLSTQTEAYGCKFSLYAP